MDGEIAPRVIFLLRYAVQTRWLYASSVAWGWVDVWWWGSWIALVLSAMSVAVLRWDNGPGDY